jgi:hypothetical protein
MIRSPNHRRRTFAYLLTSLFALVLFGREARTFSSKFWSSAGRPPGVESATRIPDAASLSTSRDKPPVRHSISFRISLPGKLGTPVNTVENDASLIPASKSRDMNSEAPTLDAGPQVSPVLADLGLFHLSEAPYPFSVLLRPPQGFQSPNSPLLVSPANDSTNVAIRTTLGVSVSDPASHSLTVTFYGRVASTPGPDFTLIALPDTQYYSATLNGGLPAMFTSQTQWIVNNRVADNIAIVIGLGDIVQDGNNNGNYSEWVNANASVNLLDDPTTTGLPQGIPYSFGVGNHDQGPSGDGSPDDTAAYNQYFGSSRYTGKSYYGGHYGTDNDNHYELFSASGMDFIVINMAYMDPQYNGAELNSVLAWANNLLQTYSTRRGIVVSHYLINDGLNASWSNQGLATYNALNGNPNLFLMLSGHFTPPEGQRTDTSNGNTINTLLSDYQEQGNGGDGYLRIMKFSPANNLISVSSYSPYVNLFRTGSLSQFTIPYNMQNSGYAALGTVSNVPSGSQASIAWNNLNSGTQYQWYAVVSNGSASTTGPTWSFTTESSTVPIASLSSSSLTFGNQQINSTSATQTLTLTNAGGAPLSIASIVTSGDYAQTNTCGSSVGAAGICTISVTFTPNATGTRIGAISFTDNASGSPQIVNLTGNGTSVAAPSVSLSITSLTFANQQISTTSAAQIVMLINTGNGSLTLTSISASGDFRQTDSCGNSVAALGSCTINVTFTPTATGTRTGIITITDNASGSPHTISLTGTGLAVVSSSITLTGKFTEALSGNTSVSSQTVTNTGFAIGQGDLIVAIVRIANAGESASTCSDNINSGNYTQAEYLEDTSDGRAMIHFYKANSAAATAGGLTITCNYTLANHSYLGALDYAGAAATNPLDGHTGTIFTTTTSSPASGSITPSQSGDLFVGSLYISEGSTVTVSSESTGFTKELIGSEGTANYQHSHTADEVLSGSVQQNYSPTFGSALTTIDIMTAYKSTGSGAPSASLSSSSLTFTSQQVGTTSAAQTITLTNTGSAALSITSIVASAQFGQTDTCGSSVAAGGSCTISVTFTPTSTGPQSGTITITNNANGNPQTVNLTGTGTMTAAPAVSLSTTSLTFGSQQIGTTSAAQRLTVTNTGSAALSITSIVASSQFGQTDTCGSSVATGGTCTISVTFTPASTGTQTGSITITDNASGNPQTVNLTGTGTGSGAPKVNVSPTSLSFQAQRVNTTSSSQTIRLNNTGTATLGIASIVSSGDYSQTNTCGAYLNVGSRCRISVRFTPTATGARTGTIQVTDSAAGSPQTVSLTGTGQ